MDQTNEIVALANAFGIKAICSRNKMTGKAWEVSLHKWHLCELQLSLLWKTVASLKACFTKSCFTKSLTGVPAFHQGSWNKLLAYSRETSCPRLSRSIFFHPFRTAFRNLHGYFFTLIKASESIKEVKDTCRVSGTHRTDYSIFLSASSFSQPALAAPSSGAAPTVVSLQAPSLHALLNCLKFRGIEHLGLQWNLMRAVPASSPLKSEAQRTSFEDVNRYPLPRLPILHPNKHLSLPMLVGLVFEC